MFNRFSVWKQSSGSWDEKAAVPCRINFQVEMSHAFLLLIKTRSSPIGWAQHIGCGVLRLHCRADKWNVVLHVVFCTLLMVLDVYSNEDNSFYLEQVGEEARWHSKNTWLHYWAGDEVDWYRVLKVSVLSSLWMDVVLASRTSSRCCCCSVLMMSSCSKGYHSCMVLRWTKRMSQPWSHTLHVYTDSQQASKIRQEKLISLEWNVFAFFSHPGAFHNFRALRVKWMSHHTPMSSSSNSPGLLPLTTS